MNLADIIIRNGTDPSIKDRTFILYRDEQEEIHSISYGEYHRISLAYANALQSLRYAQGVKATERFHVGVFMQNIPEFFFLLGGCSFTNSTLVGLNNAQVGEKLAFDINNIDMNVLFVDHAHQPGTDGTFLDTVMKAKESHGFSTLGNEFIFVTAKQDRLEHGVIADIPGILDQYAPSLPTFEPMPLEVFRAGMIIFTSGTTGAPKGIEVTWQKLFDVGVTGTRILNYTQDDVGYVCMPVNHSNSLYLNIMPAMLNGAKILLRRRFSVRNFVKDIQESGATIWNCVGDPVHYVINHISSTIGGQADFSSLPIRTVISTGTNAPNRAVFTRMFGLDIFTEVYGSTEAGAITAVDGGTPEYSVGKLLKDIRIIRENTLEECGPAQIDEQRRILNLDESAGEIAVSQASLGASAFSGYYNLPEESAKKICTLDGDDFYRMGDLGAIVQKGKEKYLIFLGRTGDWIRFKGENWTPVDGEKVVSRYPGIINAGIIGVPQAVGREDDPMYILEVADPATFPVDDLYAFCKKNLPHYMLPRFIRFVRIMPMTETMKLKKSVLKNEFYYRSPESDRIDDDIIYEITDGTARRFFSRDYRAEIARYKDPTNRDTMKAYTKRSDLFDGNTEMDG